ncbi:porin [soil metagenome]
MKKIFLIFILSFTSNYSFSQERQTQKLTWQGFIDIFYAYDFNKPENHIRQPFLYNHNRHHEFNLNLGMIRGFFNSNKIRANLALQAGTYAQDNYSQEEEMLKHVFEANVGVALNQKKTIWVDAGIFPSHIGFENAISTENLTLTRSLMAENSPYFVSGAKISFDPNERLTLVGVIGNGWQRIARLQGNQTLNFGTQVNYRPSDAITLNWSTFIGSDTPGTVRLMRFYDNFFIQWQTTERLELITGFDIGIQQQFVNSTNFHTWLSPVAIARVQLWDQFFLAGRAEYYGDKAGVIIDHSAPEDFRTFGFSLNLDYEITDKSMFRIEGRSFNSPGNIFWKENYFTNHNSFLISSIAISF